MCRTTALFLIALFSDWVGNRAVMVAIIISTAVNIYLAISMLPGQQLANSLHPYWVQPFVTLIFALAAYAAEACLRTSCAKRASAWLHTSLYGRDDIEKVSAWLACRPPAIPSPHVDDAKSAISRDA